jgi:uncharacterized protein YifN (PemK superfamily)
VEASEDVQETFKGNADQIEMDFKRIILMMENQKNIVLIVPLSEQQNANEDVEPYAHIDKGDTSIELHLL